MSRGGRRGGGLVLIKKTHAEGRVNDGSTRRARWGAEGLEEGLDDLIHGMWPLDRLCELIVPTRRQLALRMVDARPAEWQRQRPLWRSTRFSVASACRV